MRPVVLVVALLATLSPTGKSAEVDQLDVTIRTFYQLISGPAGTRDWARFAALFADGARLIPMRALQVGGVGPKVMTVEEYVKRAGTNFEKGEFYESEVARRVERFANIAHAFSTFEARRAIAGEPFARGINSIQLVKAGKEWKVITILWDSEHGPNSLPAKYLVSPADASH